jgi:hypothetical protein
VVTRCRDLAVSNSKFKPQRLLQNNLITRHSAIIMNLLLLSKLCLLAAAVPSASQVPAWHPIRQPRPVQLQKRWLKDVYDCTPEQEVKLRRDFGDAANLAIIAYDINISSPACAAPTKKIVCLGYSWLVPDDRVN